VTVETWESYIGPTVIRDEMKEVRWLLQNYVSCFVFNLKELGQLKGQEVKIGLKDDNLIFRRPYGLSEMERAFIQAQTTTLMDASLMELLRGEYASATVMLAKKDIFGNWIEWCMCGDYHPINKHMCLDKYAMPLLEEIFDGLGQATVFNTLDLRFGYH
jgi:hypothetical protein